MSVGRRVAFAVGSLLLTGAMLALFAATVSGQPPYMVVDGRAFINGEPAEDGTHVAATIDGELVAEDWTETGMAGPGEYVLQMDDSRTGLVRLRVEGVIVQSVPWSSGTYGFDLFLVRAVLVTAATGPQVVSAGDTFNVRAVVSNTGLARAMTTTVNLNHSAGVTRALGESLTQSIGEVPVDGRGAVSWTMRCMGGGPVTLTFTPSAIDAVSGAPVVSDVVSTDTLSIMQWWKILIPIAYRSLVP